MPRTELCWVTSSFLTRAKGRLLQNAVDGCISYPAISQKEVQNGVISTIRDGPDLVLVCVS